MVFLSFIELGLNLLMVRLELKQLLVKSIKLRFPFIFKFFGLYLYLLYLVLVFGNLVL